MEPQTHHEPARHVSRRRVILGIGGSGVSLALLAACGSATTSTTSSGSAAATSAAASTSAAAPTVSNAVAVPTNSSTSASASAAETSSAAATTASAATSSAATSTTESASAASSASSSAAAAAAGGGKQFVGAWPYELPPSGHFNTYIPHGIGLGIYQDMIEMPLAKYYWHTGKYMYLLATDSKFLPPDKWTASLRKGVKWSDGNDFTSKDVATSLYCNWIMRSVVWNYIDSLETPDDYTITVHMKTPSTVVERYILEGSGINNIRPTANYGPYADRAAAIIKAGKDQDSDEAKALAQDFQKFRPKALISVGPYNVDPNSITNAQLTLNKVPTAWDADQVHFDSIPLYNGETPTVTPLVLAKKVDYATHGFAPATLKALGDEGVRLQQVPTYAGFSILFNYADPKVNKVFGDKRVRQAVAMAINGDQAGLAAEGVEKEGVTTWSGFSEVLTPLWLTKDQIAKLNKYTYNPTKAAQTLDGLGWKKGSDGVYSTPDGTRAEFDLLSVTEYEDTMAVAVIAAQQMSQLGIKVTVRSETFTQQPIDIDKGKFQLAMGGWGAADPHPHFSFVADLLTHNTLAANNGGKGMDFALQQKTDSVGQIDFAKAITDSALGLDVDAQKALVFKISQAFNELLPQIPICERWAKNPMLEGVRVTGYPAASDPIYTNSPYSDSFIVMLILDGTLKPV